MASDLLDKEESQLEIFFYKYKTFSGQYMSPYKMSKADWEMKSIMAFWVVFIAYICYSLCTAYFYWWYYPVWMTFYLLLNVLTTGTDDMTCRFVYELYNFLGLSTKNSMQLTIYVHVAYIIQSKFNNSLHVCSIQVQIF